ncbi:MAG TPA: S4 domain-containing protein YaaA [Acholeplasmataceae bacterium]|jgi:ribosome-associated protein|nr:S4 domain-containing protein YaaA [Acholeplasmataceae bacterium]
MEIIKIDTEYITLVQLLKLTDLINTGGEAKYFLLENKVYLNDVLEDRRGKKIYPGDKIKINNLRFVISK